MHQYEISSVSQKYNKPTASADLEKWLKKTGLKWEKKESDDPYMDSDIFLAEVKSIDDIEKIMKAADCSVVIKKHATLGLEIEIYDSYRE